MPPTSCPWEIYRSLYGEWRAGDRNSPKMEQNRHGILRAAKAKRAAKVISLKQELEIGTIVEFAQIQDFEPLVYVMPYEKVTKLVQSVPVKNRAHPLSREYIIESLPRKWFDIIKLNW